MVSALAAASLGLAAPLVLVVLFGGGGGHVDLPELAVAFGGHVLHVALVATLSVAAAAWTRTVAQATSVSRQLAPFESGIVHVGALLWFAIMIGGAALAAWLGARFDLPPRTRTLGGIALGVAIGCGVAISTRVHRAHDWTELVRASLPPAAVTELQTTPEPIELEVWLDRDDSRRRQLERDALAKFRLVRSDIRIVMPLDDVGGAAVTHDEQYGRIVIRIGTHVRETRSTSRRELTTLIFEAVGRPLPDWSQPAYPGYPLVVDGWRRTLVRVVAYLGPPGLFLTLGWLSSRRRRH